MILRVVTRWNWAKDGLRLALVKRPDLRFLPFPWPSMSSLAQWKAQAATMVANGSFLHPAPSGGEGNLVCEHAVGYDMVSGSLRDSLCLPGRSSSSRGAGGDFEQRPGQQSASLDVERGPGGSGLKEADRMEAARSLIGPRSGLPTLKADLLRLAALLHVDVSEKDKVEDLKAKVKPMVELIKGSSSSTKAAAAYFRSRFL